MCGMLHPVCVCGCALQSNLLAFCFVSFFGTFLLPKIKINMSAARGELARREVGIAAPIGATCFVCIAHCVCPFAGAQFDGEQGVGGR